MPGRRNSRPGALLEVGGPTTGSPSREAAAFVVESHPRPAVSTLLAADGPVPLLRRQARMAPAAVPGSRRPSTPEELFASVCVAPPVIVRDPGHVVGRTSAGAVPRECRSLLAGTGPCQGVRARARSHRGYPRQRWPHERQLAGRQARLRGGPVGSANVPGHAVPVKRPSGPTGRIRVKHNDSGAVVVPKTLRTGNTPASRCVGAAFVVRGSTRTRAARRTEPCGTSSKPMWVPAQRPAEGRG